jgi:hypothetical protein
MLASCVGNDLEPIEAMRDTLEGSATLHVDEALLVDAQRARIVRRHEAVLVEGAVQEDVANGISHAQTMAYDNTLC